MKKLNNKKQSTRRLLYVLFILYLVALFYFLFFSERYGRTGGSNGYRYNIELFKEIKRFVQYRHQVGMESFIVNIVGNVLAFSPFGFLLPIISKKTRGIINVTLLCFELSLFIECVQLANRIGAFDVDDLFMNTLGGLLGYVCYMIVRKLKKGER